MGFEGLSKICLFGGGRWSKVLLTVLRSLLPETTQILWITRHNSIGAKHWLETSALKNIKIFSEIDLETEKVAGVIIATAPHRHADYVNKTLSLGIPTLCEKPFVLDFMDAEVLRNLSRDQSCALGVNLEFLYASYLHDFAKVVTSLRVRTISIQWMDPWSEHRHGELKVADFYTDTVQDMLPHCLALLRVLQGPCQDIKIAGVERREDSSIKIVGQRDGCALYFLLSRRAEKRTRRISINEGEAILDFSIEPGETVLNGNTTGNKWTGLRPLASALNSFLEVILNPERRATWPLSIESCLSEVMITATAAKLNFDAQRVLLRGLQTADGLNHEDSRVVNLLVDMFLPKSASEGKRYPATTFSEQQLFAKDIIARSIDWDAEMPSSRSRIYNKL